jgi:inosine-uridine nucleoside N-ribohydrolase
MRLLIDCDPGLGTPGTDIDDALALAIALQARDTVIEGVVVTAGNVPVTDGFRNASRLLRLSGRSDVPLICGVEHPLVHDESYWRTKLGAWRLSARAEQLWEDFNKRVWELDLGCETESGEEQISFLDRLGSLSERVTIVATAPLTNVALALIMSKKLRDRVDRIVVMGGTVRVFGEHREFNFAYDPEAAAIVMRLGVPVTIVPLDVTRSLRMSEPDLDVVLASGGPVGTYIAEGARPWMRFMNDGPAGLVAHDALAMLIALDPSLAHTVAVHARIELDGAFTSGQLLVWPQEGRLVWADDVSCDCCMNTNGSIEVVDEVNAAEAHKRVLDALTAG